MEQLHQCHVCGVHASTAVELAACSRCQVAFYCSRDHQSQDDQSHRTICSSVKSARESLAKEEATLRKGRTVPDNLFETHVGRFDQVSGTDAYMDAKLVYIQNLAAVGSPMALSMALDEAMDSLRLSRKDKHQVRDGIPVILLRLGKWQQCYDFIKWWTLVGLTRDSRQWRDLSIPYLDIHDADMAEPITIFERCKSYSMLAALAFVKVMLADEVNDVVHAEYYLKTLPVPVVALVDQSLSHVSYRDEIDNNSSDDTMEKLTALRETLRDQAIALLQSVKHLVPDYWDYVRDPLPILCKRVTLWNANDTCMLVQPWLAPVAQLWRGREELLVTYLAMM